MAPLMDAVTTVSPVRGTAVASVTGLALTAVVSGAANAEPMVSAESAQAATTQTAHAVALATTVSVPDIAWSTEEAVEASAEAPAPEPEPQAEAASRAAEREQIDAAARAAAAQVAANASGNSIVQIALSLTGIPYVWGGSTPAGFDCSGFTQYVYGMAGISIPRTANAQGAAGTVIPAAAAQPGDLVWHPYGHVGIYAGGGMVIEATQPGENTSYHGIWGNPVFVRY